MTGKTEQQYTSQMMQEEEYQKQNPRLVKLTKTAVRLTASMLRCHSKREVSTFNDKTMLV